MYVIPSVHVQYVHRRSLFFLCTTVILCGSVLSIVIALLCLVRLLSSVLTAAVDGRSTPSTAVMRRLLYRVDTTVGQCFRLS